MAVSTTSDWRPSHGHPAWSARGRRPGRRGFGGFTLVELLVVVAIIALLAGMLLPSVKRALVVAHRVNCGTNLASLAKASLMYASDNRGFVPRDYWPNGCNDPSSGNFGHYLFASRLSPYIGGPVVPLAWESGNDHQDDLYRTFKDIETLHCPALDTDRYVLHYVSNGLNYTTMSGSYRASRPELVPGAPSEILYIAEANVFSLAHDWFGEYDVFSRGAMPFSESGAPNPWPRLIRADDQRHLGWTTVVFFDGHAGPRALTPDDFPQELVFVPVEVE